MNDIIGQAPKIIAESAKSPLGIVALMTLALSFLGYLFFGASSEGVKVGMFCLMFAGYGLLAYNLVTQSSTLPKRVRKDTPQRKSASIVEQTVAPKARPAQTPEQQIPAGRAFRKLAWVLAIAALLPTALTVARLVLGYYSGDSSTAVWAWLVPMTIPPISVIVAALAFNAALPEPGALVRRSAYRVAFWLAIAFSLALLLTMLAEPLLTISPLQYLNLSTFWLTAIQGAVIVSLCALLTSAISTQRV
jgi:hypothetical protein